MRSFSRTDSAAVCELTRTLGRSQSALFVLTTLVSVLLAQNAPDYARDIVYGVVILVILLVYGRQRAET